MQVFRYQARDSRGELITGTLRAQSTAEAVSLLRDEGKFIIDLEEGVRDTDEADMRVLERNVAARRVRRDEVVHLCHHLSIMIDSGVPLAAALEAFQAQSRSDSFRFILQHVRDDVNGGASLSAAFARWPRIFPQLMISLVQAAEESGTLGLMLGRISKYLGKEIKTARQIKGALTYPCVMIVFALAITIFLLTVILPRFAKIYAQRSAALPGPTQFLLTVSNIWREHWMIIVPSVVAVGIAIMFGVRTAPGRRIADWLRLKIPIIGDMYTQLYLTRSSRTLATLLSAGVDLMRAITITRGVTDNVYYKDLWDHCLEYLESGQPLHQCMRHNDLLPANIVQMVAAGEQAGRLAWVMERIGEVTEEDLDVSVKNATQYIEPAMIVVMGAIIGFVALSLLLPIFTIGKTM